MVAATHALLVAYAREKLSHRAVREVLVTDFVDMRERDWPQLRTVSIAPLLAAALEPLMAAPCAKRLGIERRRYESRTLS